MRRLAARTFVVGIIVFITGVVYAQDYPTKPIRIVTGSVGGGSDSAARQIAQGISGALGQSMIIENRPSMAGINLQHVPYKGAGPAITALISGEVHLTINELGLMAPHVKSGKLRALAVTSATQSALAPGVPTVAASGVAGYEWVGITHLMAPAKTPPPILSRLQQEVVRYLSRPEVKDRFLSAGTEIVASPPEELASIIKSEMAKTAKLIKDAGIRME